MHILILNWKDVKNPEVGGAEVIAFAYARKLVKDGHTVTFFCRSFIGGNPEEIIDGVKIVRRGNKLSVYFHAFWYYTMLHQKPNVVLDMVNTICWQTPLYVPAKNRVAYVNQLAQEVFFYELPWPISWFAYGVERLQYLTYRSTQFLCYSQSTKSDLVSFGIPAKNIRLFPLGLDHDRYVLGKKKSTQPLFIFVARLVRMKRADLCIRATALVREKYPNVQLAVVGDGPAKLSLQALIKSLRLEKNVTIVDKDAFHIDKKLGDPKVKLMQEAWALLLPSVKEGWGMVVTEAAACGTPAIVSNVTGLRDSVLDGKTGIVLSKNPAPKELADAMVKLIEDPQLRQKLDKQAIEWGHTFDWQKSYQVFTQQLQSALQ